MLQASEQVGSDIEQLDALLARRHSCRAFRPDPVPREVIERLLATAGRTASWCNFQPWQIHVVSGEPLERLRADLVARASSGAQPAPELDWPKDYGGVYVERRRATGWSLYQAVGIGKGDREASAKQALENFRMFGAPHLVVLTSPQTHGTHGVMDCGAWVATFLLAIEALGLGAIAQAALASWPDILRAHVEIPEGRRIVCGISFGYEDASHIANSYRLGRASLDELVTWVG
ncbi:nitroreductase [Ramlibacter sp.]|uniref:nitroreductase n=1 Tax=Ramlibacter sp. TaxID=1917967 RepID=UPI003D139920